MKKNKLLIVAFVGICISILLYFSSTSYAIILDNDVRVKENSDLTYYLDISYDGKDKNVVMSSDTARAEIRSDYIYVEDKIPDGLVFKEFINSSDGSIGAVERGDSSKSCSGSVVGGYEGLKYDEATRMVSFSIKDLQAGCKLTVGIVTTTPSLGTEKRMDFFNTAFAREGNFSAKSNTVHVFMGEENSTLYNVTYQYTGEIPQNAPELPTSMTYTSGASVGVLNDVSMEGYDFSGWDSSDVSISNNSFVMPSKNVVFTGSFTKKKTREVSYSISGTIPDGYSVPNNKSYGIGDNVVIDSLKIGDEINGYRFLGWTSDIIDIGDGVFTMPDQDITLVGSFEKISYKVTYKFQGTVIPPNADSLLPEEKEYYPEETVILADDLEASGYKFLGWYKAKTFKMPANDIVIYGEWMIENGVFSPIIKKEIVNEKPSYKENDKVEFEITVQNTATYPIRDVRIEENTSGSYFVPAEGYEVLSDSIANIPSIPAGTTVVLRSEFIAPADIYKEITNEVELTGALADNNYHLDTSNEYKAKASFMIFNLILKVNRIDKSNNLLAGYEFGLYSDKDTSNLISKGIEFDNLEVGNTYYLKELTAPSGYSKLNKILPVVVGKDGNISIEGYDIRLDNNKAIVDIVSSKPIFSDLPNTFDSILIYLGLFVISVIIIIGIVIYIRKVKNKKIQQDKDGDIGVL